ncbi:ATP-grasp domain-containing protein [Candidatus Kaiserbacteria bacterium]|nr:ATP-grasp domain-containing protein [Candidatus Kaiserbacteria bacterium]
MKTILVTGIGGDIAQSVAGIIREHRPRYRLVGTDLHDQHGGSLFVSSMHVVPRADSPGYLRRLQEIMEKEDVDIVIPMTEPELAVLLPQIEAATDKALWITSGRQVVAAGIDKLETAKQLANLGLPVPWTIPVIEGYPKTYPCIIKNRFGSGSRNQSIVRSSEDAVFFSARNPEAIFQELLEPEDREVTCAVYRTRDGRVAVLQLLRRLTGGFTGWARVIDDPSITQLCIAIADGLDLRGSMNVQLRNTLAGPRVFEINPRFSSTALMRQKMGFSDVLWALDEAENAPVSFPHIHPGTIGVRTQDAAIIQPST